jgi:hypothetical protein
MMKYTYTEAFFIAHCVAVAKHNVGVTSWPGDVDDDEEEKPSVEEKPRNDGLEKSSKADPPPPRPPKCWKASS